MNMGSGRVVNGGGSNERLQARWPGFQFRIEADLEN